MGTVTVMCPHTGKQVSTGLELDRPAFTALPLTQHYVFHCWLCGHEHEWTRRWATLRDQRDPALAEVAGIEIDRCEAIPSAIVL